MILTFGSFCTLYKGIQYRLLAFWDTDAGNVGHCHAWIVKKTQKTPRKEINKAEAVRILYFNSKNKYMEAIKFYTLDEVKDKHIGEVGTAHRDKYEAELQSFWLGSHKKAQIPKHDPRGIGTKNQCTAFTSIQDRKGRNLTLSTIARVFKAMGMKASLSISGLGKHNSLKKKIKADNPSRRCVLRSGNNSNANSGLAYANANNASSNSNTNYGRVWNSVG